MDAHNMFMGHRPAQSPVSPWSGLPDFPSDEHILPGLQELLDASNTGYHGRSELCCPPQGFAGADVFQSISGITTGITTGDQLPHYNNTLSTTEVDYPKLSVLKEPSFTETSFPLVTEACTAEAPVSTSGRASGEVKQETFESGRLSSPTGSNNSKDGSASKAAEKTKGIALDKKALAKQRYREKNRKAQARHRERNKKTIEDLTAKVSSLTAENSSLKLEMAIVSTLAKAKDEHYDKLRKCKENLAYVEAESLIAESYQLAKGTEAEVSPERVGSWCMQDSANVRQENIRKMAALLMEGGLDNLTSSAFHNLQGEMMRKRQLSLRFAVGKPRFVRSLYAWERQYSQRLTQPDFKELAQTAVRVMRFTEAQRTQMIHARALLLLKMQTIINERRNLVAAAQAGAMEGVADVLTSSLEEERQAVFTFLFTFFDETLTMLQECSCDVELYPWAPDVLAISDVLMEEAMAASPIGLEGLNLPPHLIPSRDGLPHLDALLPPADQALALPGGDLLDVASVAGVAWPPETPFQLLSIPVTTRSCGTAGISLLRNVLMFAAGVVPVQLPNVAPEILTRTPILQMIRLQPELVA